MTRTYTNQKDYLGFENVVNRVKKLICTRGEAKLIYVKEKGFVVRSEILDRLQGLIDKGEAELVCTYNEDIDYLGVADDCVFTIEQAAGRKSKYENISARFGS